MAYTLVVERLTRKRKVLVQHRTASSKKDGKNGTSCSIALRSRLTGKSSLFLLSNMVGRGKGIIKKNGLTAQKSKQTSNADYVIPGQKDYLMFSILNC